MTQRITEAADDTEPGAIAQRLIPLLRELRYGSIEIVIHDGRVVQIERREKLRLDRPAPTGGHPR